MEVYLYPIANYHVIILLWSCYDSCIVQLKYIDPSHMNVMFFNLNNDTWMDIKYWIKPILVAYISGWFDDVL